MLKICIMFPIMIDLFNITEKTLFSNCCMMMFAKCLDHRLVQIKSLFYWLGNWNFFLTTKLLMLRMIHSKASRKKKKNDT